MRLTRLSVMASVCAVLAMPALAAGQAPLEDSVVGSGVGNVPQFPVPFDIDAHSGPSGENPTGTVRFVSQLPPEIRLEGPVTCLRVSGDRAVIGIVTVPFDTPVFIDVTDGTPDLIGLTFPVMPVAAPCPAPGIQPSAAPILSGDLVVTDAAAAPTTKDQCRRGGWRKFRGFKSQGDCVSFVATVGAGAHRTARDAVAPEEHRALDPIERSMRCGDSGPCSLRWRAFR